MNPAIYDRLMECLITSLGFELFESIIHMELDSTVTNHEAISNIAIAIFLVLVRSQGETILVSVTVDDCSNGRVSHDYFNVELANELILHE
jgi:ABC-type phosphate transport system permease subunit